MGGHLPVVQHRAADSAHIPVGSDVFPFVGHRRPASGVAQYRGQASVGVGSRMAFQVPGRDRAVVGAQPGVAGPEQRTA